MLAAVCFEIYFTLGDKCPRVNHLPKPGKRWKTSNWVHRILTPLSQQGFSKDHDWGRGGFPVFPLHLIPPQPIPQRQGLGHEPLLGRGEL